MILQPCNVELTKIHYYDRSKRESNLAISTISREVCQNNFNRNVIIKKNVFGHRWVLRINDGEGVHKKRKKLRVVVYILVFCSIVVAVCFGVFFSIYKNKSKASDQKIVHLEPITNTPQVNDTYINKMHENQVTIGAAETTTIYTTTSTIQTEQTAIYSYINEPSTPTSLCGPCALSQEVCLKIHETDAPKCTKIADKNDPTGCGGLCPINTHFCQILDARGKVYQCSPIKKSLMCRNSTFNCGNLCISKEKRCDGLVHCSNGSDEEKCVCDLETHFHCGNLTSCLEKKKKCDHKVDCWDKSDETGCTKGVSCKNEEIPCASGQCVLKEKFCDGKFDCVDRTDEPEGCQI
ncbi:low-density lipoprotein receptor-related protein 2-like [Anoplophora glabripennis]|uniref:low-density lipoprotein receptor-related protein 2-like n=1 Tax=Anoplophora glabripennis TaxID=217634 RepID=UPI00087396D0|nr:low-density lipoprotein receptor-related protein 2-like [Anoplophora glabripennis]